MLTSNTFRGDPRDGDDRVVRVTVGVDLGPRTAVAKFSPQAQAAYAFVSALFSSLYDHMPVYTAEPSGAERAAAATLLERAAAGVPAARKRTCGACCCCRTSDCGCTCSWTGSTATGCDC